MLIENEGALLAWIIGKIPKSCDAEPNPFAKYVLALLRKNPNEDECEQTCLNQLEVFLQSETQSFVKELFDAVRSKAYLNVPIDLNDDVIASTDINEPAETGTSERATSPEVSPKEENAEVQSTKNSVLAESNEADTSESSTTETISKSVRPRILAPKVEEGEKEQVIVSSPIRRQLQRLKVRQGNKRRMPDENSDEEYEKSRYLVQVKHTSSRSRSRSPIREVRVRYDRRDRFSASSQPPCHDYEVLGYCIRGNNCPFKHSIQPITVPPSQIFPTISVTDEGYNPEVPGLTNTSTLRQITNRQGVFNSSAPLMGAKQKGRLTNSILVRKIPPTHNNIHSINEFFQQFGDIKNIQVCFEGAPDTALVTYEQPSFATRAVQSKKAIFDNRFVYVMYYTPYEQQEQVPNVPSMPFAHHGQEAPSVKPKTFPVRPVTDYAKSYVPSATGPTTKPTVPQLKKATSKLQHNSAELLKLKTDLYLKLNEQLQLVLQDAKSTKDEAKKREVLQRVNGLEQQLQEIRNDLFKLKNEVQKGKQTVV
ncbi:PWI domain-containing protein [Ditylenchus destructor]|nr:PWI domain-containing protein [Ditylenchus destructor]